jgi:hypothetical protein
VGEGWGEGKAVIVRKKAFEQLEPALSLTLSHGERE